MIDELKISVAFTGDELYETIKLYDLLRDMDLSYQKHKYKSLRNYKTQKSMEDFSNESKRTYRSIVILQWR